MRLQTSKPRWSHLLILTALACSLAACPAPKPPPQPPPAPKPAPKPAPQTKPEPKPKPKPKPKSKVPVLPSMELAVRPELPELFAPVVKLFKDKYYSEADGELQKVRELAKKGKLPLDHKMIMFALLGHSQNMSDDLKKAASTYRRILPLWSNPLAAAKKVRRLEKEEAAGNQRVVLAVDALGEALFFLAEGKLGRANALAFPQFDGDPSAQKVNSYVKGKVKGWAARRSGSVKRAIEAYSILDKLKPEPPKRWVVAAASRAGAMHALMFEEMRDLKPPAAWGGKGDSDYKNPAAGNKPWTYEELSTRFNEQITAIRKPIEDKAIEAYQACKSKSEELGVKGPFAKSCSDWLEANGHE